MSEEADLATIAQRAVEVLGASVVTTIVACRDNQLPNRWLVKTETVHSVYGEKLRFLDHLLTRLCTVKSPGEIKQWFTEHDLGLDTQPAVAVRYRRFMDVEAAATRFMANTAK